MAEIQPADPGARRRALVAIVAIVIAGAFGYFVFEDWLAEVKASPPAQARAALTNALEWGSWAAALPLVALGVQLWRWGRRVRVSERFPPPGAKLARATPVRTGSAARAHATALQFFAVILCLVAVGLVFAAYRLAALLDQARPAAGSAATSPVASRLSAASTMGGSSLYITGVTRRASSVELTSPPMITMASGE